MRIISIHLFKWQQPEPNILASVTAISPGLFKGLITEVYLNFNTTLIISRAKLKEHTQVVLKEGVICYAVLKRNNIGITIVCDAEYPKKVAFDLISKINKNFRKFCEEKNINIEHYENDTIDNYTYLNKIIQEWQDPAKKSKLYKIKSEIKNVKDTIKQGFNDLIDNNDNNEKKEDDKKTEPLIIKSTSSNIDPVIINVEKNKEKSDDKNKASLIDKSGNLNIGPVTIRVGKKKENEKCCCCSCCKCCTCCNCCPADCCTSCMESVGRCLCTCWSSFTNCCCICLLCCCYGISKCCNKEQSDNGPKPY